MAAPIVEKVIHLSRKQLIEMSKNIVKNKTDNLDLSMDEECCETITRGSSDARKRADKQDKQKRHRKSRPEKEVYRPRAFKVSAEEKTNSRSSEPFVNIDSNKRLHNIISSDTTHHVQNALGELELESKTARGLTDTDNKSCDSLETNISKLAISSKQDTVKGIVPSEISLPGSSLNTRKRPDRQIYVPRQMRESDANRGSNEREMPPKIAADNVVRERSSTTPSSVPSSDRDTPERTTGSVNHELDRDDSAGDKAKRTTRSWRNSQRGNDKSLTMKQTSSSIDGMQPKLVESEHRSSRSNRDRGKDLNDQKISGDSGSARKQNFNSKDTEKVNVSKGNENSNLYEGRVNSEHLEDMKNVNGESSVADKKNSNRLVRRHKKKKKAVEREDSDCVVNDLESVGDEPELEWDDKADVGLAEDFVTADEFGGSELVFDESALVDSDSNDWVDVGDMATSGHNLANNVGSGQKKSRKRRPRHRKRVDSQCSVFQSQENIDGENRKPFIDSVGNVDDQHSSEKLERPTGRIMFTNSNVQADEKMSKDEIKRYAKTERNLVKSDRRNDSSVQQKDSYQSIRRGCVEDRDRVSLSEKSENNHDHETRQYNTPRGSVYKAGSRGKYSGYRNQSGRGSGGASFRGGRMSGPAAHHNNDELSEKQVEKIDRIFRQNGDTFKDGQIQSAAQDTKNLDRGLDTRGVNEKQLSWADQCEMEDDKAVEKKIVLTAGFIKIPESSKTVTDADQTPRTSVNSRSTQPTLKHDQMHQNTGTRLMEKSGQTDFYRKRDSNERPTSNRTLWDPSHPIPPRSTSSSHSNPADVRGYSSSRVSERDLRNCEFEAMQSDLYSRTSRNHSTSESERSRSVSDQVEYPPLRQRNDNESDSRRQRLESGSDYSSETFAASSGRRSSADHGLDHQPMGYIPAVYGSMPPMVTLDNYRLDFVGQGPVYGGAGPYESYYQCYESGLVNSSEQAYAVDKLGKSEAVVKKFNSLLRDVSFKETQLSNLLSRRIGGSEAISRILKLRQEVQSELEQALLCDLDLANQHNVEQKLWRLAFYQVIEMFRRQAKEENSMAYKKHLVSVLEEGSSFYESLLQQLQTRHNFNLEAHQDPDRETTQRVSRSVKLALVNCQRIMISLGDISRYREQTNNSCSYGRARSWYLKAQQIAPKNGRPYNQLAVLAMYTGRKLEAAYYYIRSLSASNPFLSAREYLLSLFDEATKKADQISRSRQQRISEKRRKRAAALTSGRNRLDGGRDWSGRQQRVEIWISGDSGNKQCNQRLLADGSNESDDDAFDGLNMAELSKRFSLDFLNVHGKLFTKIGMESFMEAAGQLMKEFCKLLSHSPCPMTQQRLLQLMAMNMFAIDNASALSAAAASADGATDLDNSGCRLLIQEQAVQLGLSMYGLIIQRCIDLLQDQLKNVHVQPAASSSLQGDQSISSCNDSSNRISAGQDSANTKSSKQDKADVRTQHSLAAVFTEDLEQFFPCIKIWSDWMLCHSNTWNPPPLPFDPQLGPTVDVWDVLAKFFNILVLVNISDVTLSDSRIEDGIMISLSEDQFLAGYIPLLSLSISPTYTCAGVEKILSQNSLRVSKLLTFADYLCGVEPPLLTYNVESRCYQSAVVASTEENSRPLQKHDDQLNRDSSNAGDATGTPNDDIIIESEEMQSDVDNDESHEISELKAKKRQLTKQITEQARQQESIEAALEGEKKRCRAVELEIRPLFLVADTNCFIDHLRTLRRLVNCGKYTLVVPLVVINELDYLARGSKEGESAEHVEMVKNSAVMSVEYLETEIESRNTHIRVITSKGTRLDTLSFRSEVDSDVGNNDDLILSCCLHFCKDMARDFMPKTPDAPIRLQRDIVLLTNDRNLRLKAHLHNVPVKDVPSFMHWANVL